MADDTQTAVEAEDMSDENIWGFLGDFMEWTMDETVPVLVVIVLLLERTLREGVAQWAKYKGSKYDQNS